MVLVDQLLVDMMQSQVQLSKVSPSPHETELVDRLLVDMMQS